MGLTTCPDCSLAVSEAAKACPGCGRTLKSPLRFLRRLAWVVLGILVLGFVGNQLRGGRPEVQRKACMDDCLKQNPYAKACPECAVGGRLDWACIQVQKCKNRIADVCLDRCP